MLYFFLRINFTHIVYDLINKRYITRCVLGAGKLKHVSQDWDYLFGACEVHAFGRRDHLFRADLIYRHIA